MLVIHNSKVQGEVIGLSPELFAEMNPDKFLIENTFGVENPLGYTYDGVTILQGIDYIPPKTQAEIDEESRPARELAQAKISRTQAVDNIVVTINNKQFDGDEISQTRMARAIIVLQAANLLTTNWVLHDNTVSNVTVQELVQALAAAGQEQTRLWMIPYTSI